MTTNTTKPTLICTENAKRKQRKSVVARLRKTQFLRQRFAEKLTPELLDEFGLLIANARPRDLRRSWVFGSGGTVHFSDDEWARMESLGVVFEGD
jgi:hypothetical protein